MLNLEWRLLELLILIKTLTAIPVDNGVVGDPEIECGSISIGISLSTRNTFNGHVYVKGRFDEPGCRSDEGGAEVAAITLPFNTCGVSRIRSLNPRGVYVSTTIIATFHPQFLTKIDRAYRVECFYMEADKVLNGGPQGELVSFATVGMQVYHKWTCDSETRDTFCMIVHSCNVDDGKGESVEILDIDGCAKDKYVLKNLEYPSDLMAGQEAHIYKFADRSQLFFQCQISLTIKEPHTECPRPVCPALRRRKRDVDSIGTVDVISQSIEALDIGITPQNTTHLAKTASSEICLSTLSIAFASLPLLGSASISTIILLLKLRRKGKLDVCA